MKTNKVSFFFFVALTCLILATCKPDTPGYNFQNQTLQGKIGGNSWTFVSGTANSTLFAGELWFNLYDITPVGDPFLGGAYAERRRRSCSI